MEPNLSSSAPDAAGSLPEPKAPTPGQRAGFGDIDGLKKRRRTTAAGEFGGSVSGQDTQEEWSRSVPDKGARAAFFAGRNEIILIVSVLFLLAVVAYFMFG